MHRRLFIERHSKRENMIRTVLLCFVVVAIIATGCKKTTPQPKDVKAQLSSVRQVKSMGNPYDFVEEYTYEESGRIKEIKYHGSSLGSLVINRFVYSATTFDILYYMNGLERDYRRLYYSFNQAGLVADETSTYFKYRIAYEYNSKGFLAKKKFFNGLEPDSYILYSYGPQDRLDSLVSYDNDHSIQYVSVFEYSNLHKNTIGNENKGWQVLGKDQQRPLIRETRFSYNYPTAIGIRSRQYEFDYNYTYDAKGLIRASTTSRTDYTIPEGQSTYQEFGSYEYNYK
jgi:hypothetical protein